MFFFRQTDPNDPRRGMNRGDDTRVRDEPHGNACEAGYVRLSRADRETGIRPPVNAPETFGRFVPD